MTAAELIAAPKDTLVHFGENKTVWRKIHYSGPRKELIFVRTDGLFNRMIAVPLSAAKNIRVV